MKEDPSWYKIQVDRRQRLVDNLEQRRGKGAWMPASAGMTEQTAIGGTDRGALGMKKPAVKPGAKYDIIQRTFVEPCRGRGDAIVG